MKIVSQLNVYGYFMCPVEAKESPLEPGVFHIPGGALDVAPPDIPEGKEALRQGEVWVFVNQPDEAQEENPPVDGVPQAVTRAQAKVALAQAGLLDQVQAVMDDPETPIMYRIAWADAQGFERSSPTLAALAGTLGLTDVDLDNLFTVAAGIRL